jgi:hypothetical protein
LNEDVLQGQRHTGERAKPLPTRAPAVDRSRGGQCALAVDVQEGMHALVHGRDPVEMRLRHLDGGGIAGGDRGRDVGG